MTLIRPWTLWLAKIAIFRRIRQMDLLLFNARSFLIPA